MKPAPRFLVSGFLALFVAALSFQALGDGDCRRPGTPLEAKALAEKAAAHLAEVGLGKAFSDFMTPQSGFMPYDLYVFVFDGEGRMWVNGRFPGLIGSNITEARDSTGRNYLLEAMRRAERDGAAWVEYQWYNPCSGRPMAKSSHIVRAGGFFIGVGAYGRLSV
ncbi:MAG: cache domain-containing protein [Proteobacteria bacterium]|nr:cache domain-containing protein [Pseudomonadota bacterium]